MTGFVVLAFAAATHATAQTPQTNLVAAFSFNEGSGGTVADASGHGNTGTILSATWTTTGKYGGALLFNGTSARVNIPDAVSLRLTTAMTLEAWVNPSTVTNTWRDVIYKGNDNYYLEATSNKASRPAVGGTFGTTNATLFGTASLTSNRWAHLAATYDGATLRLYVNGIQVSSVARTGTLATSANPLQIGSDSFHGQYFRGTIDEVRIYNVALTAAQIQADMNVAIEGPIAPDLTLTKVHTGNFTQGQLGAIYTLTARNSGTGPTTGGVAVTDALPASLTATALVGPGWTCTLAALNCTRSDVLLAGASYPAISLTVNVAMIAPVSFTNVATASGGGETNATNDTASDVTTVTQLPDLTLTKTHVGNFTTGQTGATYTITVRNSGTGGTTSTVTLIDTLPGGLMATAMSGTGWNCTLATVTCTRSDVLAAGASYSPLALTVNVATNPPASVTNTAAVSGGGETNTTNDAAADITTVVSQTSTVGLVAAYAFDEGSGATVADASGNGNSGTISGATWTAAGKVGAALSFNGTTARVTVADAASLRLTTAMTLEAWVRPSAVTSDWRDVIYKGNDNYYLEATSTNSTRPAAGGTIGTVYGTTALAPNTWTHLAVTYDRATIRLYVNGAQVSSVASTGAIATSTNALQIGSDTIYGQYFDGVIDEVRVYNNALTASQIQSDMNTAIVTGNGVPDLTVTKTHDAAFAQGQSGASYTITASNIGTAETSGTVTVSDALPGGLTATATSGTGWSCTLATLTCTRTDALAAGASYSPITLTVDVAATAPASITNTATVTGGGETNTANDNATDVTTITGFDLSPHTAVITSTQTQAFSVFGATGVVLWAVDDVVGGTAETGTVTTAGAYTPPPTAGSHTITAMSSDRTLSARATVYVTTYGGTFTRDVDNLRTGLNANETVLTRANVNATQFGKLFSYAIDGVSDASPLYVANVTIPGVGLRHVVYVATEHDSVYAFDADGGQTTPLWRTSFIDPAHGVTPVPPADTGELLDISPEIGITGSPVIDPASNTLYVVAKTKEVSGTTTIYVHRLHVLDLATGTEKFGGPTVIQASVAGIGDGTTGGQVPFLSLRENQRAALLLTGGVVYIAFAGHGDQPPYHGWVFGYRASDLQQVMALNTTPNGEGGGVWQSGDGLATDATGNVYFVTGDGDFTANIGGTNYGDSFLKVSPAGAVLDYFTPHDQAAMDLSDIDLGSGGTTLLPDQPGPHPHLAISAGKNGTIYLVDRDDMGHFNAANDSQIVQTLVNTFPNGSFITGNFKAPVYWNSRLYFSADADNIKSFQVTNGLLSTTPTSRSAFVVNYPGATLSLSSNGATEGILWAIERIDLDPLGGGSVRRPGVLHALDAANLGVELYSSDQAPAGRDALDFAAKWASPLIVNGKVFIATNGGLTAFGLLP